jgi:hypothetical protein
MAKRGRPKGSKNKVKKAEAKPETQKIAPIEDGIQKASALKDAEAKIKAEQAMKKQAVKGPETVKAQGKVVKKKGGISVEADGEKSPSKGSSVVMRGGKPTLVPDGGDDLDEL